MESIYYRKLVKALENCSDETRNEILSEMKKL